MTGSEKILFIQYKLREHRTSFLNGEIRITQQQYYRYLNSEVSDSLEGQQLLLLNSEKFTLFGNHSTYIWSSSATDRNNLDTLKKFDGYNFGLLILEPEGLISQICECLNNTPILKNCAEIDFGPVIYTDKKEPMVKDENKPLCRWTKPQNFSDEFEYRLCVHNVPPFEFIEKYHPEELHKVERLYTPSETLKTKQTFYRLIFNFSFSFDHEFYYFNGTKWGKETK